MQGGGLGREERHFGCRIRSTAGASTVSKPSAEGVSQDAWLQGPVWEPPPKRLTDTGKGAHVAGCFTPACGRRRENRFSTTAADSNMRTLRGAMGLFIVAAAASASRRERVHQRTGSGQTSCAQGEGGVGGGGVGGRGCRRGGGGWSAEKRGDGTVPAIRRESSWPPASGARPRRGEECCGAQDPVRKGTGDSSSIRR